MKSPNTFPSNDHPLVWRYPTGWCWTTPWAVAGAAVARGGERGGPHLTLSARDTTVRAKRLVVHQPAYAPDGRNLVEFVLEQDARLFATTFDAPEIRLRLCPNRAEVDADFQSHLAHLESAFQLPRWETRRDVPDWVRDVRLVLNLHCQHWTGFVFNTYDQLAKTLELVAQHTQGRHVLAYLLGWEGRYYRAYPNYRPASDLGGPDAFARLVATSRRTGIRLMPMFGAHGANLSEYPEWQDAIWRDRHNNLTEAFNRPDWDSDRSGEEMQVFLTPGEERFRRHLATEILRLVEQFDLDTVYLDTTAAWNNDPRHDMLEGYRLLIADLRKTRPHLFVAGEAWYDALWRYFPVVLSWMDVQKHMRQPELLTRFGRAIHHIERGGAGQGSTGVHEAGFRSTTLVPQVAPGNLPSINIVDTTLSNDLERTALIDFVRSTTQPRSS